MTHTNRALLGKASLAVVLAMTLAAAAWGQTEKILHTFAGGPDGAIPRGALTLDGKGNLYGTNLNGGANSNCSCGTWRQRNQKPGPPARRL